MLPLITRREGSRDELSGSRMGNAHRASIGYRSFPGGKEAFFDTASRAFRPVVDLKRFPRGLVKFSAQVDTVHPLYNAM